MAHSRSARRLRRGIAVRPIQTPVAASGEPTGRLPYVLTQSARDRLCLRRLRRDLGELGIQQCLVRQGARALGRLRPDRGLRRLQFLLGARQLGRRMTLGTRRPRPRDGQFRSAERFIRQRGLSAPGKEGQRERARGETSRCTPPVPSSTHAVCSPPPMPR